MRERGSRQVSMAMAAGDELSASACTQGAATAMDTRSVGVGVARLIKCNHHTRRRLSESRGGEGVGVVGVCRHRRRRAR